MRKVCKSPKSVAMILMKTTSLNQVDRVGSPKDNMAASRNRPSKIAKPRNNLKMLKWIRSLFPLSQFLRVYSSWRCLRVRNMYWLFCASRKKLRSVEVSYFICFKWHTADKNLANSQKVLGFLVLMATHSFLSKDWVNTVFLALTFPTKILFSLIKKKFIHFLFIT